MNSKAPALATWLLEHLMPGEKDAIAGDLVEEFRNGRSRAWFWRQALTVIFLALVFRIISSTLGNRIRNALGWNNFRVVETLTLRVSISVPRRVGNQA